MKRRIVLLSLTVLFAVSAQALCAQDLSAQKQHASWSTDVVRLEKDLYRVSVTAVIDSTWHIYDTLRTEYGPNATIVEFNIADQKRARKEGGMTVSAEPYRYYDDIFMMEVGYFEDTVTFSQDIRLRKKDAVVNV